MVRSVGPNIVAKPSMEHQKYFEQRFSYAFDQMLELARQNGVYLKIVVLEKDEDILNWLDANGNFGSGSATSTATTATMTRYTVAAAGLVAIPAGALGLFDKHPLVGAGQRRRSLERQTLGAGRRVRKVHAGNSHRITTW